MEKRIFYHPDLEPGQTETLLPEEDARHIIKVLRMKTGESLTLTDGRGHWFEARILQADSRQCRLEVLSWRAVEKLPGYVHIAVAPTKNADRLEWFVEKATEHHIDLISLLECHRSEREKVRVDRLEKVAAAAMKQSLSPWMPEIRAVQPFRAFVENCTDSVKFIAEVPDGQTPHLFSSCPPGQSVCVAIGPEGGFTPEEIGLALQHGFRPVSMGTKRLRTETAALTACHIVNLVNQIAVENA